MKNYFKNLDQKYLKICLYAAVTVLVTIGAAAILWSSGSFWMRLWTIFTSVLRPIIVGGIISYLFLPIVTRFENLFNRKQSRKWSRPLGVLLTFAIVFTAIVMIIVLIAVMVYENVEALNVDSIRNLFVYLQEEYKEIWDFVASKLESLNISPDIMKNLVGAATNAVSHFFSGLLFGVIFSVYFLLDNGHISDYWLRAFRLIFGEKAENALMAFMKDADHAFSGYIRGQFTDALIVGILVAVVLSIAGIPNGVMVGVFSGLGNMIPYVGPVVGYVMVVIVCLPGAEFTKMLIGLILLAVIMLVDGNIINPRLLSDNVEVHPLLVVAALIAGGAVGGIVGMLVAVPTAALVKLQFDKYLKKLDYEKKSHDLIDPELPKEEEHV